MNTRVPNAITNIILRQENVKDQIADCMALYLLSNSRDHNKLKKAFKLLLINAIYYLSKEEDKNYKNLKTESSFIENFFAICDATQKEKIYDENEGLNLSEGRQYFKKELMTLDNFYLEQIYKACEKIQIVAIFVQTKPNAIEVREKLIDKEIELIQASNKYNTNKSNGGLIGPLYKNDLPDWLKQEIVEISLLSPSKPIRVENQFCVVTIVKRSYPTITDEVDFEYLSNSVAALIKERLKQCLLAEYIQ